MAPLLPLTVAALLVTAADSDADSYADSDADAGPALIADLEPVDAGSDVRPPQRETLVVGPGGPDLRRVAGSAQVIGEAELEQRELNDIQRVLAVVPGVYFREEDGLGLRPNIGLRGVNSDRSSKVTLMEDGVLFGPAPYSSPEAYYFPMVTRMTSVEVYKGPGSIRFGPQTVGGALNLRTAPVPEGLTGFVDANLGSRANSRLQARVGGGTERWGVMLEGAYLDDPGFKQLALGGDTGARHGETLLKGRWAPARGHLLEAKLGAAGEVSHETYVGVSPEDFSTAPLRRYQATELDEMRFWRTQGELRWSGTLSEALTVTAVAYRHDFDRTWRRLDHFRLGPGLFDLLSRTASGATEERSLAVLRGEVDSASANEDLMLLDNHRTFLSQGVEARATLRFPVGPVANELEVGARWHFDRVRHDHSETGYLTRGGHLTPDGAGPVQRLDDRGETHALSLHAHDTLTWGRLLLAPGGRLEVMHQSYQSRLVDLGAERWQVVPLLGIGAVLALPRDVSLLAGVHQGLSPVTPGQDASIEPERATHLELGARTRHRRWRAELVGFWSEYSNITGECTGSTGCPANQLNLQYNGGAARILGLEAAASATVVLPGHSELVLRASYTLTSARFSTDFTSDNPLWGSVRAGDLIPYVPRHQGAGRVTFTRGPLSASVGLEVNGAMSEEAGPDEDSQLAVPTRWLLDASVSYQLGPVRWYVTGSNLLDQRTLVARRPYGARALAPLNVIAGLRVAFE